MAYDVNQTKTYNHSAAGVIQSAGSVIEQLGGKASKKNDPAKGYLEANFNKKIGGDFLNNRCQLEVNVKAQSEEQCAVSAEAYPVDPIGRKLTFGVRGKPAQKIVDAFFAALEAQIEV